MACTMRDIAVDELKEQIKDLYEYNLVYLEYAGNYESLMKYQRDEERKAQIIPSISEMYEEITTTWAGYKYNEEGDDNDDWENDEVRRNKDWNENVNEYRDENISDHHEEQKPFVRIEPEIGRNDPCPCGSGKKHKKCCMKLPETP